MLHRKHLIGVALGWVLMMPPCIALDSILPDAVAVRGSNAVDSGKGIGAEVAWDVADRWRVRAGVEHYQGTQEHLISLIRFTEDSERTDVGLFLDRKLVGNSGLYATAGILHPNHGPHWDATPEVRAAYTLNGRQYAGIHLSEPEGQVEYAALVPYAGIGWQSPTHQGWQVGAELGVLAGLDPVFSIHTDNPFHLPYLEQDLQAEADKYLATTQADTHLSGDQQLKASVSLRYHF